MRKSFRLIGTIVSVLVLVSVLAGSAVAAPPAPQAKWTVMVYISGDNNLEEYVVKDIELELAPTGSSANVQVVALADRGPGYDTSRGDWQTTKLYHVTQGMIADSASAVADWGERNMGDPQTLIDFVAWSKMNYPADHYVLYFWGHGWSWHPGWVMEDDTDADTLDYDEVKAAIPSLGFIDVVGYDGCNMASIEILKLWHNKATALTGSQEWVGWDGIEYDVVLAQLAANPNMTADQVAIATSQSTVTDKTWSAVAVDSRLTTLLTAVDQWAVALKNGLPANKKKYDSAFTATRSFWQAPMDKDLYDLAFEIKNKVSDTNIKNKSQAVMNAFATVVLHERHVSQYADAHGITIYGPSKASQKLDHAYFLTLDFALTNNWDEFLNTYVP
ncbi:MAG: clostripain-related cysteine peptidase [Chloroflexota bacterium]